MDKQPVSKHLDQAKAVIKKPKNDTKPFSSIMWVSQLFSSDRVVVDAKVIEKITNLEIGQIMNYLKITGLKVGLILNFKRPKLEWKRIVL
jgi:GxxExxY protein